MQEAKEVEMIAENNISVHNEIQQIRQVLESYALSHATAPSSTVKAFLFATIDYSENIKSDAAYEFPPLLNEVSHVADYAKWLGRDDMILPGDFKGIHAKIIGYTAKIITAIIWIKDGAPQEVHYDEFEQFLIVEGSCAITIEKDIHHLTAGNFLSIPPLKEHKVDITSSIPCKIILQRIAA